MIYTQVQAISVLEFKMGRVESYHSSYWYEKISRPALERLPSFDTSMLKHCRIVRNGTLKIYTSNKHSPDSITWDRRWNEEDQIMLDEHFDKAYTICFGISKSEPNSYVVAKVNQELKKIEEKGFSYLSVDYIYKICTIEFFLFTKDEEITSILNYSKNITPEQKQAVRTYFLNLKTDQSKINVYLADGAEKYSKSELGLLSSELINEQLSENEEEIFIPCMTIIMFTKLIQAVKNQDWELIKKQYHELDYLNSNLTGFLTEKLKKGKFFI